MPLPIYLAMTGAEFQSCVHFPKHCGWMACQFSPYGKGLTNIPQSLPNGSILMLNDQIEPQGHDPEEIVKQLSACCECLDISGVVLDFQKPGYPETDTLCRRIENDLACPVAVTPLYQTHQSKVLFLPPIPADTTVKEYLSPWQDREIFLELSPEAVTLEVSQSGCIRTMASESSDTFPWADDLLHTHYRTEVDPQYAHIYLKRTVEDQIAMMEEAAQMGVTAFLGLYQEACSICPSEYIGFVRPQNKEAGYGKHLS